MHVRARLLAGFVTLASACSSTPPTAPPSSPAAPARSRLAEPASRSPARLAAQKGGRVSSVDAAGLPQFLWAAKPIPAPRELDHEQAARWHLDRFRDAFRLDGATLRHAELGRVHDLGRGGVIASLRQKVDGIDVYRAQTKVLMRRDHELVAIAGHLQDRGLLGTARGTAFRLSAAEALTLALADAFGVTVPAHELIEQAIDARESRFELAASDVLSLSQSRARKLYVPVGQRLVAAWAVEAFAGRPGSVDAGAFRVVVSAEDGSILARHNLTSDVAFKYTVWADANNRPLDGPQSDFTPHPTGVPDKSQPSFIAPSVISIDGFNHPAGATAGDPWLASSATQSSGNNVDAYTDGVAPDGYSNGDLRATTTASRTFARTYDTALSPVANQDQGMAAVIQAFYLANWMHDWWYDSGFDELAQNAQLNNYGRGGQQGDPMHLEIQDGYNAGSRNNANMSTPEDGLSPRMQIYVWSGSDTRTLTLGGVDHASGAASFGPTSFDVSGNLVLATDAKQLTDGCTPADLPDLTGAIALVDRGNCNFVAKTKNLQGKGAIGVLIADNAAGTTPPGMSGTDATVTIPTLSITQADGVAVKAALQAGAVPARLYRVLGVERDGALDNTVVGHEWGHYLHHRLADCVSGQCSAMSEGWADFNALMLVLRDGDPLDAIYPMAVYSAVSSGDAYFGIRRFPYSVDPAKNPLTLAHIQKGVVLPTTAPGQVFGDNNEVHNAGEVWANMMFEVYVALQKARGTRTFEEMHRQMSDYVVAGLSLTPPDATYLEQRDAVLAAIGATSTEDQAVAAAAFARRGAGTCAVVPDRYSADFVGVTESTEVKPILVLGAVHVDDSVRSCDDDGVLDGDEQGHVTIALANAGPVALENTVVTVTTETAGVTLSDGGTITVPSIAAFGSTNVQLDISIDPALAGKQVLTLNVKAENAAACQTEETQVLGAALNVDNAQGVSATDDVEASISAWTTTGTDADKVWSRATVGPAQHAWVGVDYDGSTDTQLTSPDLKVSDSEPFVIDLDHKYSFEAELNATDATKNVYYDGAVIELSSDGGQTWVDVSTLVTGFTYPGTIVTPPNNQNYGNVLAGHPALVSTNAAWPEREHLTLDFGTAFAGQTVRVRFRIASDTGTGAAGWELDNLALSGIVGTPFTGLVEDTGVCVKHCEAGLQLCGTDLCTQLATDSANCGACGNACAGGQVCSQGQCVLSCQAGLTDCSGSCVNVQRDNANCGACGNACAAGEVCSQGACTLSCQAGLNACDGTCANLETDDANCGACNNHCLLGHTCVAGSCESGPPTGGVGGGGAEPKGGCSLGGPGAGSAAPLALVVVALLLAFRRRRFV